MSNVIIYTGNFILPDGSASAQRVIGNAKILRDMGFQVILVGVDPTLPPGTPILDTENECEGFATWSRSPANSLYARFRRQLQVQDLKAVVKRRYRTNLIAIICYNYPSAGLFEIRRLCKRFKWKFICDATEWYDNSSGGLVARIIGRIDTFLRMRVAHRYSDGVITISPYLTKFYSKAKRLPIVEIPPVFDKALVPAIRDISTISGQDTYRFIYAGAPFSKTISKKNRTVLKTRAALKDRLDIAITAIISLRKMGYSIHLSIYGVDSDGYLKIFPEHSKLLSQNADCVEFYGARPRSEVMAELVMSDFTIFFRSSKRSVDAGFPSKLSESISYGTPVITTKLDNIKLLDGNISGLFLLDSDDPNVCAEYIREIISNNRDSFHAIRKQMLSESPFDYRKYTERVETFVEKVGIGAG